VAAKPRTAARSLPTGGTGRENQKSKTEKTRGLR